ncbi:hypothetical protein ARMSODRAFT_960875 [Armillaria solidipes]|uniref:Uncharacterized protein n=1 Tax=Armillaria solidipes TaxID=1076256 RepID=A0A2H3B526_9AGAR|nr:hypothetical protein ARMSODRAFT_960875 [Armillaria solidipes]
MNRRVGKRKKVQRTAKSQYHINRRDHGGDDQAYESSDGNKGGIRSSKVQRGGRVGVSRVSKTVFGQSNSGDSKIGRKELKYIVVAVARKPMVVVRSQDGTGLFGFVCLVIYWQLDSDMSSLDAT